MGSLLEGIENTQAPTASKSKGGGSETAKTIKLVVAIGGLLIGGLLIAYNMGVFGGSNSGAQQVDPNVPADVAAQPPMQIVKPTNAPSTTQPRQPKTNANFH